MTSFSWFSGKREPSRKFIARPLSVSGFADDSRALHLAMARGIVHDGVMLRGAVVPEGEGVALPAEPNLVLGDVGLRDEVREELRRAGGVVLPVAHVARRVEVGEMRCEGVHEE